MTIKKRGDTAKNTEAMRLRNRLVARIVGTSSFVSRKYLHQKIKPLFDEGFYRKQLNEHVKASGLVEDFCARGWKTGLDPHPLFDVSYYLSANPDVEQAGVNPLLHFLEFGAFEKRSPHPLFDVSYYLLHNPDVEQTGANPLLHYLRQGAFEGKSPILFLTLSIIWRAIRMSSRRLSILCSTLSSPELLRRETLIRSLMPITIRGILKHPGRGAATFLFIILLKEQEMDWILTLPLKMIFTKTGTHLKKTKIR